MTQFSYTSLIIAIFLIAFPIHPKKLHMKNTIEILSDHQTIEVDKNTDFKLKFSSNPTTGYNWYIKLNDETAQNYGEIIIGKKLSNTNVDSFMSGDFEQNETHGMVGVGGQTTFEFTAKKEGTAKIVFYNFRIWDLETLSTPTVVTVKVK